MLKLPPILAKPRYTCHLERHQLESLCLTQLRLRFRSEYKVSGYLLRSTGMYQINFEFPADWNDD